MVNHITQIKYIDEEESQEILSDEGQQMLALVKMKDTQY